MRLGSERSILKAVHGLEFGRDISAGRSGQPLKSWHHSKSHAGHWCGRPGAASGGSAPAKHWQRISFEPAPSSGDILMGIDREITEHQVFGLISPES